MNRDKLIATIYFDRDFGRSIATSIAGLVGLAVYVCHGDWVVALFSTVIAFPVFRVCFSAVHARRKQKGDMLAERLQAEEAFSRFSRQERQVIGFFVRAGGACVSWNYVNKAEYPFPRQAANSLMERGVLRTSLMEDGITESFVLDIDTFDLAQKIIGDEKVSISSNQDDNRGDPDIPF